MRSSSGHHRLGGGFAGLQSLEDLKLRGNSVPGGIMLEPQCLPGSLRALELAAVAPEGPLPALHSSPQLCSLSITSADWCGVDFNFLSALTGLTALRLAYLSLDAIPQPFDALAGLQELDISCNFPFQGWQHLGGLHQLSRLYARWCDISSREVEVLQSLPALKVRLVLS